jgi:hypothetical protein
VAGTLAGTEEKSLLLLKPRGFCAGVVRAIRVVRIAQEAFGPPIYVRKEIVCGGDGCAAGLLRTLSCVLPISGCDKKWYLYRRGSVCYAGSLVTTGFPDLQAIAPTNACTTD